ncbi:hypothetical protein LCGC14_1061660 [marine sediment metagenome]|uniref:Uncharacterized protein n=1 Tax=marine sediment metagenome TaxID=412755 RepID=A0A0F9N7W9_9ZZZZ
MLTINKKVTIYRKPDISEFSKKNIKVLPIGNNKIGSSVNAVNAITLHSDMLGSLMPKILGSSKSETEFTKKVSHYWNSISVNISPTGKELEIGFVYDREESSRTKAIGDIKGADGKKKEFNNNKQLAEYVESYIDEGDKWKYGIPINNADYLLWRYCLNYKAVANTPDTAGKSNNIRFYIHNEVEVKKIEKEKFDIRTKAGKVYFDVIADISETKKYLYALGKGASLITMDDLERSKLLEKIYLNDPQLLIDAKTDKQLDKKSYIEECIIAGILRRLENSTVIVNASDNKPIGNTMKDAIVFLELDSNAKIANEIEGRLRALPEKQ